MAKMPGRGVGAPRVLVRRKRPSVPYSLAVVRRICRGLEAGMTLSEICRKDKAPSYTSVYHWMHKFPDFNALVAAARQRGADALADEVLDVARGVTPGTVSAARVRMQGLQWAAGKASPRRYGARAEAQVGPPRQVTIRVRRFEKLIGPDGRPFLREIMPEVET